MGNLRGLVRRGKDGFILRVVVDPPVNDLPEFNDYGPFASDREARAGFVPAVRALRAVHAKAAARKWAVA